LSYDESPVTRDMNIPREEYVEQDAPNTLLVIKEFCTQIPDIQSIARMKLSLNTYGQNSSIQQEATTQSR
jgi:hypothetical protein